VITEQRDRGEQAEAEPNEALLPPAWIEESRERVERARRQVEHTKRFLSDLRSRLGDRLDRDARRS